MDKICPEQSSETKETKRERFNRKKIASTLLAQAMLECPSKAIQKRGRAMLECASTLILEQCSSDEKHFQHVKYCNYCKGRGCPICEVARAEKNFSIVMKGIEKLRQDGFCFMFLTLSTLNCCGEGISNELKTQSEAFYKMIRRKDFDFIEGYVSVAEVERSKHQPLSLRWNVHRHIIICMDRTYFNDPAMLSTIKKHWADCVGAKYEMTAPDIRYMSASDDGSCSAEICYTVAKYISTDSEEKRIDKEKKGKAKVEKTPIWQWTKKDIQDYLLGIHGKRLISSGGNMKMAGLEELNNEDQNENGQDKVCPVCSSQIVNVQYDHNSESKKYIKTKILTDAEVKKFFDDILWKRRRKQAKDFESSLRFRAQINKMTFEQYQFELSKWNEEKELKKFRKAENF